MSEEVLTCPKCGALVSQHTTKCRQCGHYLMGSFWERSLLWLLPEGICPATALLYVFSIAFFLFTSRSETGFSFLGASMQRMLAAGSTTVFHVYQGEWWRLILSNFIHYGILHLGFNLWAGKDIFLLANSFYRYQKSFLIFLLSGTFAFVVYAFIPFVFPFLGSGSVAMGASAGLCGLMGAIVGGAKHFDLRAQSLKHGVKRWFFQVILFGLIILPWWSTGLHLLGFVGGYGLAYVITPRQVSFRAKKIYSNLFVVSLLLIFFCIFLQFQSIKAGSAQ